MPRTERRGKAQRCLACGQMTSEAVRFEAAAPYCRPCGEDLADWHGWTLLQDRRTRNIGPPEAPHAPPPATDLPVSVSLPPDRRPLRPEGGRRRRVLPCAACRRQLVPIRVFEDGRMYCDDCGPRIQEKMGLAPVPERRTRMEGSRSWFRYAQPTSGFYLRVRH